VFDEDEGAARAAADQVRKDAEERAAKAAARSPQCRAPQAVTAEPEDTDASVIDMTLADAVVQAALIEAKAAVEQAAADANAQAAAAANVQRGDDKLDDTLEPAADFVTPPACMQTGDVQVTLNLEVPKGSEEGATRGILVAVDGIPVVPTTASALKPARKLLPCKLNVDGYVPGGQSTKSPTNASPPSSMRLSVEHDVHMTPWGERSPLSASAADNAGALPQYSQCSVPSQPPSRSPADKAPSPPPRSPRRDAMAWSPRQEGSSPQGSRVSFRDSDSTGSPLKACSSPLKAMHAAR
jgi:hypothetical protein